MDFEIVRRYRLEMGAAVTTLRLADDVTAQTEAVLVREPPVLV